MHPVLRGPWRAFLTIISIFFLPGCLEYNQHPNYSEAAALSNITQLTDKFDRAGEAYLSPDLRWIAFRGVSADKHPLYLAKTVLNQNEIIGIEKPIRITPFNARSEGGSFSSRDLLLIFSSTGSLPGPGKFPSNMRIYRLDGWEGAVAMNDDPTGMNLARHPLLNDPVYNGECRFSPDGRFICFTSTRNGNPNLYVMHPDGSHIVQLTHTQGYDGQASFSPDGKHLVYCSDRDANHFNQIYIGDLAFDQSGEVTSMPTERAVTYDNNMNLCPAWYPDGTHIVYSTSRHGRDNYELYLMDKNGRKKTRITYTPGADLYPVFTPDGRQLMWTSKRAKDGSIQVFIARFQFPLGS